MIVAGFGMRAAASLVDLTQALSGLPAHPQLLATLRAKGETEVFQSFASSQNLATCLLEEDEIAGIETPTRSSRILARFGTGSLAEAAALVAARRHGTARLIHPRHISTDGLVTVALAEVHPQ
ncbi:precorrin methylase [Epibacterium sp. SM1979]|uniref:Precorrin methylase n=1 Tax=Tritonibacter litoralis TaxID=2662264 RepID=A0A843YHD2_9RHOB|nr:cobalamin biosynthesis protein [Tritonibacter litoralis]MQQ08834.1 precorrin methylase [Tritonibacter litoralis]